MGPTHFKNVDASDAQAHVGYLDAVSAVGTIAAWKRRSIDLAGLRSGDRVLEVGCGNGDEARAMAARIGPGEVTAIDVSEKMLEEARARGSTGVVFTLMDAHELRFPDESFDACRCERTLQHVADPSRVVGEMARVVRRGGRVVLLEPDWETLMVSATDAPLTRRILDNAVDLSTHPNGRVGRRLPALLADAGLRVVAIDAAIFVANDFATADRITTLTFAIESARSAGVITADDAARWLDDLNAQTRRGTFLASLSGYTAVGEKL